MAPAVKPGATLADDDAWRAAVERTIEVGVRRVRVTEYERRLRALSKDELVAELLKVSAAGANAQNGLARCRVLVARRDWDRLRREFGDEVAAPPPALGPAMAVFAAGDPAQADAPTPRQRELLDAMCASQRGRGRTMTVREMGAALGGITTNAVHELLVGLERRGLARRVGTRGDSRRWVVVRGENGEFP
jgi:nitroreductase